MQSIWAAKWKLAFTMRRYCCDTQQLDTGDGTAGRCRARAMASDQKVHQWYATAPKLQQLPNSRSADTLRLLPSEYEDKAAERQLDLRRERNTLESAVKSQKDTKHGEFAQFAPPGCSLEQLAVTHLCHATTEIQHQRQHAEQSQKKCNEQRVALLVWNLTMNIVIACCNYQGR